MNWIDVEYGYEEGYQQAQSERRHSGCLLVVPVALLLNAAAVAAWIAWRCMRLAVHVMSLLVKGICYLTRKKRAVHADGSLWL